MATLYSIRRHTGTGSVQLLSVPPYISKSHIFVYVNQVLFTSWSWVNDTTISLTAPAGQSIVIQRRSSPGARLVDYDSGVSAGEEELDLDSLQAFYLAQESSDIFTDLVELSDVPLEDAVTAALQANASASAAAASASSVTSLAADLAGSGAGQGANRITFNYGTEPTAGSAAQVLRAVVLAESFFIAGESSWTPAFQRAVDHCAAQGGGTVITRLSAITFAAPGVTLKEDVEVRGLGAHKSVITKADSTFHAFHDGNVRRDGCGVHGFTIRRGSAPTPGQTDRGIFLDADGTERASFTDLHFENMFRGLHAHQVGSLEFDKISDTALLDSGIYIGEVPAKRSRYVRRGTHRSYNSFTAEPASGGGCQVLAYVDSMTPGEFVGENCGPSTGAVNLHHGLYARSCGDADLGFVKVTGQKRGASLHCYADITGGEQLCGTLSAIVISDGAANYSGVRVDACLGFTLRAGSRISTSWNQAGYFSRIGLLTVEPGVQAISNNRQRVTSSVGSAAWLCLDCTDVVGIGVVMKDPATSTGQYGQGCGWAFQGATFSYTVAKNVMTYPTGAVGYYFVSHGAGATVEHPVLEDNRTSGPQSWILESVPVAAGRGICRGNVRISANVSPLMTLDQVHRWRVSDNWNEGVRFPFRSDGVNIEEWRSSVPGTTTGYVVGDKVWRTTPSAGFEPGYVLVNGPAWKNMAALQA